MEHNIDMTVGRHMGVGPVGPMYGHGPVTYIGDFRAETDDEEVLYACLDCGYVTADNRELAHTECDREQNHVNATYREKLPVEDGFPDPENPEDWPIE